MRNQAASETWEGQYLVCCCRIDPYRRSQSISLGPSPEQDKFKHGELMEWLKLSVETKAPWMIYGVNGEGPAVS
jgi:hypothetical protein